MRRKIGVLFMVLGLVLICGSLQLHLSNQQEAERAEESVKQVLPQILERIPETPDEDVLVGQIIPDKLLKPEDFEMTVVEVEGYPYVGYLSIPALGLDLPVMADWDLNKLQLSPCRYYGNLKSDDLVIMAHNYVNHFGRLSSLKVGDPLFFSDMDGIVTCYEVVGRDVLPENAVEEMTAGDFDLTLFTCTYGRQSRVTVYCEKIS